MLFIDWAIITIGAAALIWVIMFGVWVIRHGSK